MRCRMISCFLFFPLISSSSISFSFTSSILPSIFIPSFWTTSTFASFVFDILRTISMAHQVLEKKLPGRNHRPGTCPNLPVAYTSHGLQQCIFQWKCPCRHPGTLLHYSLVWFGFQPGNTPGPVQGFPIPMPQVVIRYSCEIKKGTTPFPSAFNFLPA